MLERAAAEPFGTRYTGVKPPAWTPATHTTNYPIDYAGDTQSRYGNYATQLNAAGQLVETLGRYTPNPVLPTSGFGPGQVGKWETKSDSMEDGITADLDATHAHDGLGHQRQAAFPGHPRRTGTSTSARSSTSTARSS